MLTATMHQSVSNRNSDEALLRAFADSSSEKAFGALVDKYLGMVLGIAMRRTSDRSLAEEIAQDVFTILARKARGLKPGSTLAGWIHRVTIIECAEAMRRETSARTKMNAVSQHLASELDGRDVWRDALPLLDEGIDGLSRAEREVVLLRFFERKSFREIGTALGKSDDAAQKQTERALEKLSGFLKRKGVSVPVAALGAGLTAHLAQAAPPVLTKAIAHGALLTASTLDAKILILKTIHAMTNTKLKTAIVATAALTVPIVMQWAENNRLREALNSAQRQQQRSTFPMSLNARPGAAPSGYIATGSRNAGIDAPDSTSAGQSAVDSQKSDPADAAHDWEHVLFIADPLQRSQQLAQLLAALTPESAPQIAEAFERVKKAGIKFADEQRLFLRAWGKLDGQAAVKYAVDHGGQASNEAVAALGGWAAADPQQAKGWLEALPESKSKETLIYGLLDGWSTVDFPAAAAYAESRPSSPARDSFRELLLQRALRSGGIAAAQSWVDHIPANDQNRDYKKHAFADVVRAMLYRDPAAAARWISELDGQTFVGSEAVANTAAKLAEASPTDALAWLTGLKSTEVRKIGRGAGAVLQTWSQQDPEAAGAWLQQNANHPYYDQMAASYARSVASVDPLAAKAWTETIRSAEFRKAALLTGESQEILSNGVSFSGDIVVANSFTETVDWKTTPAGLTVVYKTAIADSGASLDVGLSGISKEYSVASPPKKNPHGSGPQWANCASCHNSAQGQ